MNSTPRPPLSSALLVAACLSIGNAQVCPPGWIFDLGTPGANAAVRALAIFPNGDFMAGGSFSVIDGQAAPNKLARYSFATGTWSPLTVGTNASIVYALAVMPNGDLLAGGNFNSIGGAAVRQFGRYDFTTQTWSDLGYGNNGGAVEAILILPNNDVIIGGSISRIAGVVAQHIGRYTPSTGVWTRMNSNFNSSGDKVTSLALAPDGTVIMGGVYLSRGSGTPRIQRYHPVDNTWSSLGTGLNNTVSAVVVLPDGDVIAGGSFTSAGGIAVSRLARYNPGTDTWSNMGGGTAGAFGYINALTLLPDGDVVAGGSFTSVSGVVAARIARYNPATNTWSALSVGVNQDVDSILALPTGDIIVGGVFTNIGGRIGRYTFGGTAPTITDNPESIAQVCSGDTAEFTVQASGSATLTYQWRKDGAAINVSMNPSASTHTLVLSPLASEDVGAYDCIVTNSCDSIISQPATLDEVAECSACPADFNQDGGIDGADVDAFFAAWVLGDTSADTNLDGGVDGADVDTFFVAWVNGGC